MAEKDQAYGLCENKKSAQIGGNIAKKAKDDCEERTGQKVVTGENFLPPSKQPKQIKNKSQ